MRDLLKQSTKNVEKPIVWIDCEMTGLDVFNDHIIEICCIITDGNLNIIDEDGYESVVYQPKEVLDAMNEWCINQHTKSGLVAKILASPEQVLPKVQTELYDYIQKYIPNQRTAIMAGNSIHMDKFFMMKEFPKVVEHLHYRLIDVSTIMEFGNRHNPQLMKQCPKKTQQHTAKSDILESIAQLQWYRDHYFKSYEETKKFIAQQEDSNLQNIIDDASKLGEARATSTRKT
ncbi:ribonuclease H-like protein [Suhomyces tanzawaensis NRRL Y-17324]|uniref:Ribonuclease H-like protein n=1 Tax=Suhomyces tanzawaensis NRRL Y-17324 TaxID=984487 RepID=A0A1E4SHS9_9ASCO|nr:ribonuclease H-like protein [Suhomyces tanzawaensis NRRL Y-17324]ODV79074.1 ribonuclease H-like protein [Suhomyces tanzawaensis NRRL Y-17324]